MSTATTASAPPEPSPPPATGTAVADEIQTPRLSIVRTAEPDAQLPATKAPAPPGAKVDILKTCFPLYDSGDFTIEEIRTIAQSKLTVLMIGPTGSGKTQSAEEIHALSKRARAPYAVVDCNGIVASLFESEMFGHAKGSFTSAAYDTQGLVMQADNGTLFLDEIADIPLESQGKLLTLIEKGEFRKVGKEKVQKTNVRIIAATNKDLEQAVRDGTFREDLYYRLNGFTMKFVPLRQRPELVPDMAQSFLNEIARKEQKSTKTLSADATAAIQSYGWPGNLREMKSVLYKAFILSGDAKQIEPCRLFLNNGNLAPALSGASPGKAAFKGASLGEQVQVLERRLITEALQASHGDKSAAANALGMNRRDLYRKIFTLGIEHPQP